MGIREQKVEHQATAESRVKQNKQK